jgi:hypothetical protein
MTGDYTVSSRFYNKYRTFIEKRCFYEEYERFVSGVVSREKWGQSKILSDSRENCALTPVFRSVLPDVDDKITGKR